jgi:uncharacterized protein YdbL (DUF1318 family)
MKTVLTVIPFVIIDCLTVMVPPVSVTGTKTATEKQIIGEQTELEKDVWMISSAKTTSGIDVKPETKQKTVKQEIQEENAQTYKGFAIMDTFAPELTELKKDGVVGENKNGLLSNLLNEEDVEITRELKDKYKPDSENTSYKVLVETVRQINQARYYIVEGYILNQKRIYPEFNPDKKELLKNQKSKYQSMANKGEYIQQETGEWIKKK